MEKKSLGRGLKEISSTFMTPEEELKPEEEPSFLSTPVRKKLCTDCLNMIKPSMELPRCKIFSFKNDANEPILPNYMKYCCYFQPINPGKHDNEGKPFFEKISGDMQFNTEVEETVNRQKKIAIQDDGNVQNSLKKLLSQHLEEGYEIIRIDLEKKEEHGDPTNRVRMREEVTIFKKGIPSF